MSLLKRVEQAQRRLEQQDAATSGTALVPVMAPKPAPTRDSNRQDMLGQTRIILQAEIIKTFSSLLDATPEEQRAAIEGIVDRVVTGADLTLTRDERALLIEQMIHDVSGFGPL